MDDQKVRKLILEVLIEVAQEAERLKIEVPFNDYGEAAKKLLKTAKKHE